MGDITLNISRSELKCSCNNCNVTIQDHEPVIQVVQDACKYYAMIYGVEKVRLEITSAARCYEYNRSVMVGSNDESQHPRCCAMDIKIFIDVIQVEPSKVYRYLNTKYPDKCGIGNYRTFTHIDTRNKRSRW